MRAAMPVAIRVRVVSAVRVIKRMVMTVPNGVAVRWRKVLGVSRRAGRSVVLVLRHGRFRLAVIAGVWSSEAVGVIRRFVRLASGSPCALDSHYTFMNKCS